MEIFHAYLKDLPCGLKKDYRYTVSVQHWMPEDGFVNGGNILVLLL